ncbi:ABC transporter permease [Paenibacillus amylolyticus]|uniref:ABC transporter permease n=1 Tax=Paenibacillus amylolyticus TaxID=1451 RepID=A0ABD8AKZ8_PAEAM|nr:ABC transporter permease [Paenibacillus amylolyticus]OMF01547.1 ABC transporter permease [Paenibacillus amylolyticus]
MNRIAERIVNLYSFGNRTWVTRLLLLLPALALMGIVYLGGLLIFGRYSFDMYENGKLIRGWDWGAYRAFLSDPYYWKLIGTTFRIAFKVTLWSLLLAYPLAYCIAGLKKPGMKQLLLLLTFLPLLVSAVVRSYGWQLLLSKQGFMNWLFIRLGLTEEGFSMIYNETGVVVALVHIFLPFMVFPILNVLSQSDASLKAAAQDLGAGSWRTFLTITLPLSARGIASGVQIVFTLCLTAFTTPQLIGGGRVMTLPVFIYQRTLDTNWPMAAVASLFLLVSSIVVSLLVNKGAEMLMFRRSRKGGQAYG